jgi:hypothetical protein
MLVANKSCNFLSEVSLVSDVRAPAWRCYQCFVTRNRDLTADLSKNPKNLFRAVVDANKLRTET